MMTTRKAVVVITMVPENPVFLPGTMGSSLECGLIERKSNVTRPEARLSVFDIIEETSSKGGNRPYFSAFDQRYVAMYRLSANLFGAFTISAFSIVLAGLLSMPGQAHAQRGLDLKNDTLT